MEQQNAVHYEIQCEKTEGQWTELEARPKTEEEIHELCDRARATHPRERIRAVKVTTTVTIETVPEEAVDGRGMHLRDRVHELLQDCD